MGERVAPTMDRAREEMLPPYLEEAFAAASPYLSSPGLWRARLASTVASTETSDRQVRADLDRWYGEVQGETHRTDIRILRQCLDRRREI